MLGHVIDTAVILAVVVINAAIGVVQEGRAEQALAAHSQICLAPRARCGERAACAILRAEVVPGDILLLEVGRPCRRRMGDREGPQSAIDESILTGESVASSKAERATSTGAHA